MGKYLKKFETTAAYNAAKDGLIKPNVSYVVEGNGVYYAPVPPPYQGFCKLTLNNGEVVELEGSGQLTLTMISSYQSTLVSAEIGELCTSIGYSAFNNFNSLTSIIIPNNVTSIGKSAFQNCTSLASINIPNSVTSIGQSAFQNCTSLASCTIGSGVTSIGDSAFYYCSGLTTIDIPSGVTSIGDSAFGGCSGLTSMTVDSNNTVFDSRNNCNAIIETSTNKLIQGCKNTVIPNSVTSIGGYAFYKCTYLTSIEIPNSVTSIGNSAFWECGYLSSVTIGSGVTSIGNRAFYFCSSLTSITSLAMSAPTIQNNTFENVKTGGTLYVPIGSSGYNTWMGTGNYYLGKYSWTKVEQ